MSKELDTKHLEFIQAIIGRLANNSFLLKGWTVTLAGVFVGFAAKDADYKIAVLAYFPVLVFGAWMPIICGTKDCLENSTKKPVTEKFHPILLK